MPIIEMKAFEHRFEAEETTELLIAKLTDAVREVLGDGAADETWVIVEGVSPKRWGFGGELRK